MGEVEKLQRHLDLLKSEYMRLQKDNDKLRQNYELLASKDTHVNDSDDTFASKLLQYVASLYNSPQHSDVNIAFDSKSLHGHWFVLNCRSNLWRKDEIESQSRSRALAVNENTNTVTDLVIDDLSNDVGEALFQWVYTDNIPEQMSIGYFSNKETATEEFLSQLLSAAHKFQLTTLKLRCQQALFAHVASHNAVSYYEKSDSLQAPALHAHCESLLLSQWPTAQELSVLPAPLLLRLLHAKCDASGGLIHDAVRTTREDVVLLCLLEYGAQMHQYVNEPEYCTGDTALNIALTLDQHAIAELLLTHSADINLAFALNNGTHPIPCIQHSIIRKQPRAVSFLVEHGALLNTPHGPLQQTALHLLCKLSNDCMSDMLDALTSLLKNGADPNLENASKETALHMCISTRNSIAFQELLCCHNLELEKRDCDGYVPAWRALVTDFELSKESKEYSFLNNSFSLQLFNIGADINSFHPETKNSLLIDCLSNDMHSAALFLIESGAKLNLQNQDGFTALHFACKHGHIKIIERLLQEGGDPNIRSAYRKPALIKKKKLESPTPIEANAAFVATSVETSVSDLQNSNPFDESTNPFDDDDKDNEFDSNETETNPFAENVQTNPFEDENSMDNNENNPFSASPSSASPAPVKNSSDISLTAGGDFNEYKSFQPLDVVKHNMLVEEFEITDTKEVSQQTPLHVALFNSRKGVVDIFLEKSGGKRISLDFTVTDSIGQTVFSQALWLHMFHEAEQILKAGAEMHQDLLEKAINLNDEDSALFLLAQGWKPTESALSLAVASDNADVTHALCVRGAPMVGALWTALSYSRFRAARVLVKHAVDLESWHMGPNGIQRTLLHRAIDDNLERAACFLAESGCDISATRQETTPLHEAAKASMSRLLVSLIEAGAQVNARDSERRTALHIAISHQSKSCVKTLLGMNEVNIGVRDSKDLSPLGYCVVKKDEESARLLLARDARIARDSKGYSELHHAVTNIQNLRFLLMLPIDIDVLSNDQKTALHLAAANGHFNSLQALIQRGASLEIKTPSGDTALLLAAANGHSQSCEFLLKSRADVTAVNNAKESALHLAILANSVSTVRVILSSDSVNASAVNSRNQSPLHLAARHTELGGTFTSLLLKCKSLNLDAEDENGTTALLSAYMRGNVSVCRALLTAGASLGNPDKEGISIFTAQTASQQLLFTLLQMVLREPKRALADSCQHCLAKFTMTFRRHHCRHCGRSLCHRCSEKTAIIPKFNVDKPVRVCDCCFDALRMGGAI